jgi:ferric-dicitrate binding protein FerR (iron transport regulator)
MLPRLALTLALVAFVCPRAVFAQTSQPEPESAPAHVAYVQGAVILERDGRPENAPLNMPLLSGDRLKTVDGRVEVLFADGSALHLDAQTTVDIQSDDLVRLIDGRVRLNIAGPARGLAYRVDSPAGSVRITQTGEYRIAMLRRDDQTQLELAVLRGAGEIFTDEGTTAVRAGERAYASAGLAPSYAYT